MPRIFLSHASANNDIACEIRDWLFANGWRDEVFLDLDPLAGIHPGERWKNALRDAAHRCEVVLALVSPQWLASDWCRVEIEAARLLDKRIMLALIGVPQDQVPAAMSEEQCFDLLQDRNDGYVRLKGGLHRAGLDPSSFPFPEGRRPYPGFRALEEQDAAVFFGRDAQIVRGLDKLRGLARNRVERMLVILGASGSGKSSFMRAGLWPRLKRDDRNWLPLPTIRPERAILSGKYGLAAALQDMMSMPPHAERLRGQDLPKVKGDILEFITDKPDGLARLLEALRHSGRLPAVSGEAQPLPTIILPVDQGEELFNEDAAGESTAFIDIITRTLAIDGETILLMAMRSDSFPLLQSDERFIAVPKDTFNLDIMLAGSYRAVIEGPAGLVKPRPLKIDAELTEALLRDLKGQGALPLLAFTLERLYEYYGSSGALDLSQYQKLGGLNGVIAGTVRDAFAKGVEAGRIPAGAGDQIALARAAFIPHLARVNAAGEFVRHVATLSDIPAEAHGLIDLFVEKRLLIKDRREIDGRLVDIVEVTHEALLREWDELNAALKEESQFLIGKGQLESEVKEWQRVAVKDKDDALITGLKLARARNWLEERPQQLSADERDFIGASRTHDQGIRRRRRRRRSAMVWGGAAFAVAAMATGAAFVFQKQKLASVQAEVRHAGELKAANDKALAAEQIARSKDLARRALDETKRGDATAGLLIALEVLDPGPQTEVRYVPEAQRAVYSALQRLHESRQFRCRSQKSDSAVSFRGLAVSPDGQWIAGAGSDGMICLWDRHGKVFARFRGHSRQVNSIGFSFDGTMLVTGSNDHTAKLWRFDDIRREGTVVGKADPLSVTCSQGQCAISGEIFHVEFHPGGKRFITARSDNLASIHNLEGRQLMLLRGNTQGVKYASFNRAGDLALTASKSGDVRIWQLTNDAEIARSELVEKRSDWVRYAAFDATGRYVLSATDENTGRLLDTKTKKVRILKHRADVFTGAFSPKGGSIATGSFDGVLKLWDMATGKQRQRLLGHGKVINKILFGPAGSSLYTASSDGTIRAWRLRGALTDLLADSAPQAGAIAFSRDASKLITTASGRNDRIFDAGNGMLIKEMPSGRALQMLAGAGSRASTEVKLLIEGNKVLVVDRSSGRRITELTGHSDRVLSARLSANGKWAITGGADGSARIWDVKAQWQEIARFDAPGSLIVDALLSADNARLATRTKRGVVHLYALFPTIEGLKEYAKSVVSRCLTPDQRRLANLPGAPPKWCGKFQR